jgi:glycosyltransferase involved in cell wall biosynthesis
VRILFMNSIKSSGWRGGEKWMVEAAAGLKQRGHAVGLAVRPGSAMAEKAGARGIPVFPLKYGPDIDPINALRVKHLLKQARIDLVCTNFEKENRLLALATLKGSRPVIVARKGLAFIFDKWRYRIIYGRWVKHIVTPSDSIASQFRNYKWLDQVGISVIPNGVCTKTYAAVGGSRQLRDSLGVPPETPTLGFVGDLAPQKGVDHLLRAVSEIVDPWHLVIVGGGGEREKLEGLCDSLSISSRTTFTGHRDDVEKILPAMDIVVSPSLFEGMPNALLEAMAAGRPVVASAVDGISEVVTGPELGLLVPPGDVGEIRKAIVALMKDPATRSKMGDAARGHVTANYSIERMIDGVEGLFSRLVVENQNVA